jgi:glyceraldehyde 3-phosphate dehydrogenase
MLTSTSIPKAYEKSFDSWVEQKKDAVRLISAIGKLLYDKGVELVLFRNPLLDVSPSEILHFHDYAEKFVKLPIQIKDTANLAEGLLKLELIPSKIDIGKLAYEWSSDRQHLLSRKEFLKDKLESFINKDDIPIGSPTDVVLYGFGRIGRLCAREIIKKTGKGQQLRLRAIVTRDTNREELEKRIDLLRMDSIHGEFSGVVELNAEDRTMIINGQIVHIIHANEPSDIDYTTYGIKDALVIDNTGVYRSRKMLEQHLIARGIDKILLTAPGEDIPNIVFGVNHNQLLPEDEKIWAAGSCTNNAIVPIIKVLQDAFGIEKGHIQSVHAYTNDQNLLDNMHKKNRRGRSAALNMVITETDAANAIEKVMPILKNKITANAVRVPTPNGSLAIITADLKTQVTKDSLDYAIRQAALSGDLVEQIKYSFEPELVSNDIKGSYCCSVYDSHSTIVAPNGKSVVLYIWYDNEYGYTQQVLHLAKYIAEVRRPVYF